MQERRARERFKLRLPSKIEVEPLASGEQVAILKLETDNICSGGAFFQALNPLVKGTRVKIDIMLNLLDRRYPMSGGSLVKVKGEVLRSEPTGMAVRFDRRHTILSQTA